MDSRPGAGADRAMLTDFGLAKPIDTQSRYTRTGETLGTPQYMSPEQARGELSELTPASDVWGLGAVLYELLAGQRAFGGNGVAEIIAAVITQEPTPVEQRRPDVPAGVRTILRSGLAKRVTGRYRVAGLLRDDLDRVLSGQRPWGADGGRRSRRWVAVAAGAGLLALAAWGAGRGGRSPGTGAAEPALSTHAATNAEQLAEHARRTRAADPAAAADELAQALAQAPERHAWRIELALWRWAQGQDAPARAALEAVPETAREWGAARLYLALQALGTMDADPAATLEARADLQAAAAGNDRYGNLARAALAIGIRRYADARRLLQGAPGWEAALLRGQCEVQAPDGDSAAAIRDYDQVLNTGLAPTWALVNRAYARGLLGDDAGSRADAERALAIAPDYADAYLMRGVARAKLGDPEGAIQDYDATLARVPEHPVALFNKGVALDRLGRAAAALAAFDAALAVRPGYAHAHNMRGLALLHLGDVAAALDAFAEAIRLAPDDSKPWYNRGNAHERLGRVREAIADYTEALARRPDDADALDSRGSAWKQLGRNRQALEDHAAALRVNPKHPNAHYNRGVLLLELGRLPEAVADFDRALELDPRRARALVNRGIAYARLDRPVEARRDLEAGLALDATLAPGWRYLAQLAYDAGDFALAIAHATRAIALDPRYGHALGLRAKAGLATRDYAAALADLDAGLRVDPRSSAFHDLRGRALAGLHRYREAIAAFDAALVLEPHLVVAWSGRALACWRLEQWAEAERSAREAIRIEPDYGPALVNLGSILRAQQRWAEAADAYRTYLDRCPTHHYVPRARAWLAECEAHRDGGGH